jgi:hypothetical protein
MQGLTFLIFRSELCSGGNCTFGRGAGFSVAAIFAFFMAGLCFAMTKDYPGDRDLGAKKEQEINKSGFIRDAQIEEGNQTNVAPRVDEDEVMEQEANPAEEVEEEIFEEEVVDEYDEDIANEPETNNTANIHEVNSRFKDAEA